jgi:hypothetical protein
LQALYLLEYACGLQHDRALIVSQNPIPAMTSNCKKIPTG